MSALPPPPDLPPIHPQVLRFTWWFSIGVLLVVVTSLLEGTWRDGAWPSQPFGSGRMSLISAVYFLFSSLAVSLQAWRLVPGARAARGCLPISIAIALIILVGAALRLLLLLPSAAHHCPWLHLLAEPYLGRSAFPPASALAFFLLALALLSAPRGHSGAKWTQALAAVTGSIGWVILARAFYGGTFAPVEHVSYSTGLAAILLSAAILCSVEGHGWMRMVTGNTPGGALLRRFLPGLAIPFIVGWLRLEVQRAGWIDTETGISLFALSNVILFAILCWINARSFDRAVEAERVAAVHTRAHAEQEAYMAAIVESSDDAIIGTDLDGVIQTWNSGAERMFGYNAGELLGRSILLLTPADRHSEGETILAAIKTGRQVHHLETVSLHRDGSLLETSATISPVRDATGQVIGAAKIARNITERKRSEAAVRQADLRLQTVMEHMTEGLVLSDLSGKLLHWNPAAIRLHKYDNSSQTEGRLTDFIDVFELSTISRQTLSFAEWPMPRIFRGERLENVKYRLRHKHDGWEKVFSYSGEIVHSDDGQALAFITITDITDQQQAEDDRQLFRALVDESNDAFEVIDPASGRFLDINTRGCELRGYTREEYLRLSVFDLVPALTQEIWKNRVEQVRQSRAAVVEGLHRRKDGSTFPVEVSMRWVDFSGAYLVCCVRDISERRRAEDLLRESAQRFREIAETLPQLVWTCRGDGFCDYLSPQWLKFVGDPDGNLGDGWLRHVHPEDRGPLADAWKRTIRTGASYDTEFRLRRFDGEYRWFRANAVPLMGTDGNVTKWFGTHANIHEERELREELRKAQSRLQHTLEIGGIGTFSIDYAAQRTTWDGSLEKLCGRHWDTTGEASIEPFLTHVEPEDRTPVRASIEKLLESGHLGHLEYRYRKPDGSVLWLATHLAVERQPHGPPIRLMGASIDITQRMHAEQVRLQNVQLESENRKVQEANRLKSEFLANMSHELRTPLNGIIGFTEFLLDGRPGELNAKQREYLTDVYESSQHLLQLINDVLDLSKIESGKLELHPVAFRLPQAIEQVCGVVRGMADKQHVSIETRISAGLNEVVLDLPKFKQVLYNLLSNAVKFTDAGGRAEIVVEPVSPHRFRLEVRDTGIGIREADLPKLFQEFVQLDSGSARRFEGTGLGLALTRRLVQMHEGEISVKSVFGSGTIFSVELPLNVAAVAKS